MNATLTTASLRALGTTAVLVVDGGERALQAAQRVLVEQLDAIDAACSRFRDDSELASLNRSAGRPTPVSPLLLEAIEAALRAADLTAGAVDPTVGRAVRLLGYSRDFAALDPAGPPLTLPAEAVPGWPHVRVDRARATVQVPSGVELDLGATAKALAADRAAEAASRQTGVGVLVSLGGDLAAEGPPPATGWSVRVTDDHAGSADSPGQTVVIRSGGLATSGTTVRRWRRGKVELHHLVDPRCGDPVRSRWRTATVAAGSCLDANIASTAAVVLGEDAIAWLAERRLPARLVSTAGDVTLVGGWPRP